MKLVHKLFAASMLTGMMIVITLVVVMPYMASRYFADYQVKMQMEQLTHLIALLAHDYDDHQGWSHLKQNSSSWGQLIEESMAGPKIEQRPFPPAETSMHEDKRPPHPWAPFLFFAPPPPGPDPGLLHRLSLFDDQKRLVAGAALPSDGLNLRKIVVNGKTIGWLGYNRPAFSEDPMRIHFMYEQIKAVIWIGLGTLLLAALIAFILSRHLLRPIQQLSLGAHALASRKFESRIDVRSSDELGELATDFNKMADTLERYEHMRRQWIADISHELRTPLAILRGEVEAVLDGIRDMKKETLESIHAEVLLLTKIVNDLHALTIIDSEAMTIANESVDILQIVQDVLGTYQNRFSESKIEIIEDLPRDSELMVEGDSARLTQVFSNIFENTLRYTDPPGKMRIRHDLKTDKVIFIAEDSAPGVPDVSLPFIFERLYRVENSRNRTKGGSGLGLAICKAIIENMGGHIVATQSLLGGLQIMITLPLVEKMGRE